MTNEINAGNRKMAAYMGLKPRYNAKDEPYYKDWNPHTDLNQLFQVVDNICEVTGWKYELIKGYYHALCFIDGESTIILKSNKVREAAIYAAVLEAIDHIEKQTS